MKLYSSETVLEPNTVPMGKSKPTIVRLGESIGNTIKGTASKVGDTLRNITERVMYGDIPEGLTPEMVEQIDEEFGVYLSDIHANTLPPYKYGFEYFPGFLRTKYPQLSANGEIRFYLVNRHVPQAN